MAHKLPPLRFGYEALEPYPQLAELTVEDLLHRLDQVPDTSRTAVRNNAGGTSTTGSSGTSSDLARAERRRALVPARRASAAAMSGSTPPP